MTEINDVKRFNDIHCEIEGITTQCRVCGSALQDAGELGQSNCTSRSGVMRYVLCSTCDKYFMVQIKEKL